MSPELFEQLKEIVNNGHDDFLEKMKEEGGLVFITNAFKEEFASFKESSDARIKALEEEVINLGGSPSPHNTHVPESLGPADDNGPNGFM